MIEVFTSLGDVPFENYGVIMTISAFLRHRSPVGLYMCEA